MLSGFQRIKHIDFKATQLISCGTWTAYELSIMGMFNDTAASIAETCHAGLAAKLIENAAEKK